MRLRLAALILLALVLYVASARADAFDFESVVSLDDMRGYLTDNFPLGTPRDKLRTAFVSQGQGRLFQHPNRPAIEKYVYDINLCRLYVWRWNISANFNGAGELTQVYVNRDPVHAAGDKQRQPPKGGKPGAKQQISKVKRPPPEANKGEKELAYLQYDLDAEHGDVDDEFIIGGGPSRADPKNLGKLHVYKGIERWRSIFDDETVPIVPYEGTCP